MAVADRQLLMDLSAATLQVYEREQRGSGGEARASGARPPTPRDLPAFLPYALAQLQAPFSVHVTIHTQDEYVSPLEKKRNVRSGTADAATPSVMVQDPQTSRSASALPAVFGRARERQLHVAAGQDTQGRLVELAVRRERVPCLLLKLLGLCAPHQVLLTRLSLRACRLDALALHQLIQLLPRSNVTDLILDDSPVHAGGYHLLLDAESRLRVLSLDRCALGDAGAVKLAGALCHPCPASRTLKILSLVTNGIGDVGAAAFGDALRSNRRLQYLNLADNRVTDAGAAVILRALCEFQLSPEELVQARRRRVQRLKRRLEVFRRIYTQLLEVARTYSSSRKRKSLAVGSAAILGGRLSMYETLSARAELLADEEMGPFSEPFGPEETWPRGGAVYSRGNGVLRWLDLAYNALGRSTLMEVLRVLRAQPGEGDSAGLLRVVLEGNPLPVACAELSALAARLDSVLDRAARQTPKKADRISRPRK